MTEEEKKGLLESVDKVDKWLNDKVTPHSTQSSKLKTVHTDRKSVV